MHFNRRNFLRKGATSAAGLAAASMLPLDIYANSLDPNKVREVIVPKEKIGPPKNSIRFSVIGINHGHIYGMVDSLINGGGTLVAVYAKEADLLKNFTKRYPNVKIAKSEEEIIDDNSIQLVASAAIPIERAPIGLKVMTEKFIFLTITASGFQVLSV